MNLLGASCALLAAAIWGGLYVVSKYVLDFVPPVALVVLRFAIGLTVLAATLLVGRGKLVPRPDLPEMALIGLVGFGISIVAQFAGTQLSTAANGALITSATPALVVVFAYLILREPLLPRRLLGLALAMVGVAVTANIGLGGSGLGSARPASDVLAGNLLLVLAALSWALYSVLVKRAARRYPVLTVTTYAMLFGLLFTAPFVPVELARVGPLPPITGLVVLGVLYIGVVSTAGAFYLWNKGLALLDASAAAVFFFAQPIVGSLLGWLVLREQLDLSFFVGGGLIFAGIALASLPISGIAPDRPSGIR